MLESEIPQTRRIKAPCVDNTALIKENALTLIGRVTNPQEQRIWALLPALPRKWQLQGRATGSDLGNGLFQYRFEREEDLQRVLDNRPYHFAYWMVIIQRWEPIISASFPSQIPFWIRIKGLPLHFWLDEMVCNIGKDLGTFLNHELTKTSARVKVLIDGLKPITKKAIIEFESGEESLVYLEYEKLENHCLSCHSLNHLQKECPETTQEARQANHTELLKESTERKESYLVEGDLHRSNRQPTDNRTPRGGERLATRVPRAERRLERQADDFHERRDRHGNSFGARVATKQTRIPPPVRTRGRTSQEPHTWRNSSKESEPNQQVNISPSYTHRGKAHEEESRSIRPPFPQRGLSEWRVKNPDRTVTGPSTSKPPTTIQQSPATPSGIITNHYSEDQISDALNEATLRYINCPDQSESAARRLRVLSDDRTSHREETLALSNLNMSNQPINHQASTGDQALGSNLQQSPRTSANDKIMQDMQDVTRQYLCVSDPVEAAARRQRVITNEAEGLLEQTAANILAAEAEQRRPLSPWERGIRSESPPGIDFDLAMQPSDKEDTPPPLQITENNQRRRSTTLKSAIVTPNILNGTSSRKRNISQMKFSPGRNGKTPERKRQKSTTHGDHSRAQATSSTQASNPPIHLIPAVANKKQDFRLHPHRAP